MVVVGLALGAAAPAVAAPPDASGAGRPATIPALTEWVGEAGAYQLTAATRILVRPDQQEALGQTASTFAADLSALGDDIGRAVEVTTDVPRPHDIVLELGGDAAGVGDEGYRMTVGDAITVSAPTDTGVFYGTRTLVQLFHQGRSVAAGEARDVPRYGERGLMVDLGRMHFSYDWLADHIRDMGYLKLNTLHLHLTDDEGWRIESDLGIESAEHLTKDEVRRLVELAARYHITVIPEIDMPAHLGSLLAHYPQYRLTDADGVALPGKLDYSIPEARQLLFDLVEEYLPLFPGAEWHMGSDEYLANSEYAHYPQLVAYAESVVGPGASGKDGSIALVNEMNDFVQARGKTLRMWNDIVGPGTMIEVDRDVVIDWWTDVDSADLFGVNGPYAPQTLLDKGYEVVNSSFLPTYDYPTGGQTPPIYVDYMYDDWSVHQFYGYLYFDPELTGEYTQLLPVKEVAPDAAGNRGSLVHMWNSGGTWTQEEGAQSIFPRLRMMAQKTWESPAYVSSYAELEPLMAEIGSAPDPALELSASAWAPPADGGTTALGVAANLVTEAGTDADWLTVTDTPLGLTLAATANAGAAARTATVTVVADGLSATVAVTQAGVVAPVVVPPTPPAPVDVDAGRELVPSASLDARSGGAAARSGVLADTGAFGPLGPMLLAGVVLLAVGAVITLAVGARRSRRTAA